MFHQSDKKTYINTHWKIYRFQRPPKRDYINEKGGLDKDDDHFIYKFKLKMANTLSVMTNVLRNAVSKQRIRYKENGFDLDLTYINENIIAMGYPADKLESIYRNRYEDVYKFLEENHPDHYKVYNLCLERVYDNNKFHGRVVVYPFKDHNPPTVKLIEKFCSDVDVWLKADVKNVVAIHCKAGKGRTGTMICCYLLYSGQYDTAEDALAFYDSKRTKDGKGVTIPSQRRYVQYFSKLLRSGLPYEKRTLQFCEIRFTEAHALQSQGTVNCSISVLKDKPCAVEVKNLENFSIDFRKSSTLDLRNCGFDVTGDIKIELTSTRKKIFHFWVNTYFIANAADIEGVGDDAKYVYTLNKSEIDDVHKDKEHKNYSEDFKVQLIFYVNANNRHYPTAKAVSGNRTSSSNNYEFSNAQVEERNYMTNNSFSLNTMGSVGVSPMAMTTQLNNSGSNLSYNCDQRSSSSSASVSSLVGGSGSDSTKMCANKFPNERKLNMNSNGIADSKVHPSSFPLSNSHRNADRHLSEDTGTESLLQSIPADYNNFSIANNISAKQRQLRQHHNNQKQQQKEEQQQYQPSENNVAVPPFKVSRGSRSIQTQINNHITQNTTNHIGFDGFVSGKIGNNTTANNIIGLSTNNGVLNVTEIGENDHEYDNDVERDIIEDDDAEEDWESGESSAISLPHLKAPSNTNTTIDSTFHKTTLSSPVSLNPSTKTRTARTLTTRTTNNTFLPTFDSKNLTGLRSMNLTPFTNTSPSSRCSLSSKAELGGENDGNDCIRNVINDTEDSGDDDKKKVHSGTDPKQNGNAVTKQSRERSRHDETLTSADNISSRSIHKLIAVPPTTRNKFFPFTLTKTLTLGRDDPGTTVKVFKPSKQPFFRRRPFKATSSNAIGEDVYTSNDCEPMSSLASTGLGASSKQTLKIKLKKNRLRLAQNFQKIQSFLRTDPDDFCKNFAERKTLRKNSNCSLTSRNQKAIALTLKSKLSASPEKSFQNLVEKTSGARLGILPSSLEQLTTESVKITLPTTATQSSSSLSPSVTASNASLGSSGDCDLGRDCDDYYSSICDNQLSFDNSPCKSPRSLVDIALVSGGTSSFNSPNFLGSSLHQRIQQYQQSNQNQLTSFQNQKRLPFLVSNKCGGGNGRSIKDHQKPRHEASNNVVVVAAKPAKTHAIGFNVKELETIVDDADSFTQTLVEPQQKNNSLIKDATSNGFVVGTFNITSSKNSSVDETDRTSVYFTPPTSESTEYEVFDLCSSNEGTKSSKTTPFVFSSIVNELKHVEHDTAVSDTKATPVRALNLQINKNCNTVSAAGNTYLNNHKTPSIDEPSLGSTENIEDSSATSISNGNNTADTGTSSSGFSNSDCCTSSSSSDGRCNCNPLQLDLERYEASLNKPICVPLNATISNIETRDQLEVSKTSTVKEATATIDDKETAESITN